MAKTNWTIQLKPPFSGLTPGWYLNDYPTFGNQTMAGRLESVDLTDPSKITQGPKPTTLTNGTESGAVDTLIKFIVEVPTASDTTYGIGGNKLYEISSTAVTNAGSFPHTINHPTATGEDGESIVTNGDDVYYFYNHSTGGDIGKYNGSTFDDDWGSTVPATGAATLNDAPHPSVKGPDGLIYFANGRYVGYYDPLTDTMSAEELDLYEDTVVVDLLFERNILWIATNSPNNIGSNQNRGVIYTWDTVSESFQEPVIELIGTLGGIITRNGIIYTFYQDLGSSSYRLGYVSGDTIQAIPKVSFTGALPNFGQKTIYQNHIVWTSNQDVYMWGANDEVIPVAFSNYSQLEYSTSGAIANPFGTLMSVSNSGSNYATSNHNGYGLGFYKSITYSVAQSVVETVEIEYEPTSSGAVVDLKIERDQGLNSTKTLLYPGQTNSISHANDSGHTYKVFRPVFDVTSFRLVLDWASGSNTNPLSIRNIKIKGHTKEQD